MRRLRTILVAVTLLYCGGIAASADLSAVRAESNLQKRSDRALDYAADVVKTLDKAYHTGGLARTQELLAEIRESVELAYTALKESGRNPRRHPKYFKRAELKTRDLLKRLGDFEDRMAFDDREKLAPLRAYVQKVHDEILKGVLGAGEWQAKQ